MFKIIEQIIHITFNQQHIETQTERHIHSRTKDRQETVAPSFTDGSACHQTLPPVTKRPSKHNPLSSIRFRNEWCINLPNHAIIGGSEHLIRNTNRSEELTLKTRSLSYIFFEKGIHAPPDYLGNGERSVLHLQRHYKTYIIVGRDLI